MFASPAAFADDAPPASAASAPVSPPPTSDAKPAEVPSSAPSAPAPAADSLEARRAKLERAELELDLREREAKLAARRAALEHPTALSVEKPGFSRSGRLVFPQIVGVSSYGLLGTATASEGTFVSGLFGFALSSATADNTTTTIAFRPRVDLFVTDRWTVGLAVDAAFTSDSTLEYSSSGRATREAKRTAYTLAAAPRIGHTFDVGPAVLWPNFGFGYGVTREETKATEMSGSNRTLWKTVSFMADLDVVFPLTTHVILDMGPTLAYRNRSPADSARDIDMVDLGFRAHLGITF